LKTCPMCGDLVRENEQECKTCGYDMSGTAAASAGSEASPESVTTQRLEQARRLRQRGEQEGGGYWTCPMCGDLVWEDDVQCGTCGHVKNSERAVSNEPEYSRGPVSVEPKSPSKRAPAKEMPQTSFKSEEMPSFDSAPAVRPEEGMPVLVTPCLRCGELVHGDEDCKACGFTNPKQHAKAVGTLMGEREDWRCPRCGALAHGTMVQCSACFYYPSEDEMHEMQTVGWGLEEESISEPLHQIPWEPASQPVTVPEEELQEWENYMINLIRNAGKQKQTSA